jgi:hypothetical protein
MLADGSLVQLAFVTIAKVICFVQGALLSSPSQSYL